jgi:hypothetical protein
VLPLWVWGQRVCVVQAKRRIHSGRRRFDRFDVGAPQVHGHFIAHGLMWAPVVLGGHPGADAGPRLAAIGIVFQMHYLIERHSRSMKILSNSRPRPFIEIITLGFSSAPVNAALVN